MKACSGTLSAPKHRNRRKVAAFENIVQTFFGHFLPLETAEVDREDHKEHLPKLKLPK